MAEGIVHLLEAIQVDEQQRQHILRAARTLDLLLQLVEEQAAVGQIRERIEIRLVPDDFLRLAFLGHVMDQRNAAALAIRVGQVGSRVKNLIDEQRLRSSSGKAVSDRAALTRILFTLRREQTARVGGQRRKVIGLACR